MKLGVLFRRCKERSADMFIEYNKSVLSYDFCQTITSPTHYEMVCNMIDWAKDIDFDYLIAVDADAYIIDTTPLYNNFDKIFCHFYNIDAFRKSSLRPCAIHLYSKEFMNLMSEVPKEELDGYRFAYPEGAFIDRIHKQLGIRKRARDFNFVGTHDYCQYRKDIFYKYVLRAWRQKRLPAEWKSAWIQDGSYDSQAALEGCQLGLNIKPHDINKEAIYSAFKALGIPEKESTITTSEIDHMVADYEAYKDKDIHEWNKKLIRR